MLSKLFSLDLVRNLPWPDRRELSFLRARSSHGPRVLFFRIDGLDELDRTLGGLAEEALILFLETAEQNVRVRDDFTRIARGGFRITLPRATPTLVNDVRRRLESVHAASTIASTTRFAPDDDSESPLLSAS